MKEMVSRYAALIGAPVDWGSGVGFRRGGAPFNGGAWLYGQRCNEPNPIAYLNGAIHDFEADEFVCTEAPTSSPAVVSFEDPCNAVVCSLFCDGVINGRNCGWNYETSMCSTNFTSTNYELTTPLGLCILPSKVTTRAPTSQPAADPNSNLLPAISLSWFEEGGSERNVSDLNPAELQVGDNSLSLSLSLSLSFFLSLRETDS